VCINVASHHARLNAAEPSRDQDWNFLAVSLVSRLRERSQRAALLRNSLTEEFTCPKCSSQSVVYPASAKDDDDVTCRGCGANLGTLAQFRQLVARRLLSKGAPVSGC
jgi:ribosomal protein S27E